ncbi:uncharacterized protein LOC131303954 [Rhododendron vialii]|uniref:uncharacterized protein LOC131303954 n=1 Tax=Rhododendron vialii TaxID=182163 RepID=UPI00265EBB91|nr:uncharacterized protein LOC131303954 [Rhododendron vialii]
MYSFYIPCTTSMHLATMTTEELEPELAEIEGPSKKARRTWRQVEEDTLLKVMINEVCEKWKWPAENGFRPGFFTHCEVELAKVLADANIKANPHINSKVRYWKQTYHKILDITGLSGMSWDHTNKRIVVDDPTVWAEYEKAYPRKAKGMNMKPFPMFDDWVVLFGKDRATGEGAEDPSQMAMSDVFDAPDDVYMPHFGPEFDGSFFNEPPSTPTPTPTRAASTPPTSTPHRSLPTSTPRPTSAPTNAAPKKGRKRTRMGEEDESIHASMATFMKDTSSHIGDMVSSIGYEKNLSKRHENVQAKLGKLNITLIQKFKLSACICQEEQRVDNFYGCKEEERQEYVEAILNGEIYGPI